MPKKAPQSQKSKLVSSARQPSTQAKARVQKPKTPKDEFVIRHTEVIAGTNPIFTIDSPMVVHLNPGDGNSFNWMSRMAINYEFYRFESLRLNYQATCPVTTDGAVYAYVDFDPSDEVARSVQTFMNNQCSHVGAVYQNFSLNIPASNLQAGLKWKRVRSAEGVTHETDSTFDSGYLALASSASGGQSGIFSLTYVVRFKSPQVPIDSADSTSLGVSCYIKDINQNIANLCVLDSDDLEVAGDMDFIPQTINEDGNVTRFKVGRQQENLMTVTYDVNSTLLSEVPTPLNHPLIKLVKNGADPEFSPVLVRSTRATYTGVPYDRYYFTDVYELKTPGDSVANSYEWIRNLTDYVWSAASLTDLYLVFRFAHFALNAYRALPENILARGHATKRSLAEPHPNHDRHKMSVKHPANPCQPSSRESPDICSLQSFRPRRE